MQFPINDQRIVEGLTRNDSQIINYLYSEIGPKVKRIILNTGGTKEEANDVFQEGIITIYENIRSGKYQLRPDTKLSTYLIQICKYKWYDIARSSHKKRTSELDTDFLDDQESAIQGLIRAEQYKEIHSFIDQLGGRCKEILLRFYWERESMKEIGDALDMDPKSVKNGKYRCMQQLQTLALELKKKKL